MGKCLDELPSVQKVIANVLSLFVGKFYQMRLAPREKGDCLSLWRDISRLSDCLRDRYVISISLMNINCAKLTAISASTPFVFISGLTPKL